MTPEEEFKSAATGNWDALSPTEPAAAIDSATSRAASGETEQFVASDNVVESRSSVTKGGAAQRIGRYLVVNEIARGGMGVVYRAVDTRLGRTVALKMIRAGNLASSQEVDRFLVEAQAAAQLDHPGIVPIFEIGEEAGSPYFAMALVEGSSLQDRLRNETLPARDAAGIVRDVAEAVQFAHAQGIIHRDLKPHNILLDTAGRPKVTDFGMAKRMASDSGLTQSGQILGTPSYMAPEQAAGDIERVGVAADVYSLGAILYCLLTGRPPFQAASVIETLRQVQELDPPSPRMLDPTIPADLETICLKCLSKPILARYSSAQELSDDLGRFLNGEPIRARPIGLWERTWRWCARNKLATGLLSAAALLLVALAGGAWYRVQLLSTRQELFQLTSSQALTEERLRAAQELRDLHEYYSSLNRVREASTRSEGGWTWTAATDLARTAELRSADSPLAELRSLAADIATRHDARVSGHVAEGVETSVLSYSPDGQRIAVAVRKHAARCEIQLYDTATRESVGALTYSIVAGSLKKLLAFKSTYQDGIRSMAWSPDGRWLAAGTRFGRVIVWDTQDANAVPASWETSDTEIYQLEFSRDGRELWARDHKLRAWDAKADWKALELPDAPVRSFALHPQRAWIVICGEGFHVRLLDRATLTPVGGWPLSLVGQRAAISHDGRWTAIHDHAQLRLLSTENGAVVSSWQVPSTAGLARLQFAGDDQQLVTLDVDNRVRRWEIPTGREIGSELTSRLSDTTCDMTQDGRQLALATADRQPRVDLYELRHSAATWAVPLPGMVCDFDWSNAEVRVAALLDLPFLSREIRQFRLLDWDVRARQTIAESLVTYKQTSLENEDTSVAWQPDGKGVAWSSPLLGLQWRVGLGTKEERTHLIDCPLERAAITVEDGVFSKYPDNFGFQVESDPLARDGSAAKLPRGTEPVASGLAFRRLDVPLPVEKQGWAAFASVRVEDTEHPAAAWLFGDEQREPALDHLSQLGALEVPHASYHWYFLGSFEPTDPANSHMFLRCSPTGRGTPATPLAVDRLCFTPVRRDRDIDFFGGGDIRNLTFAPDGRTLWGLAREKRLIAGWSAAGQKLVATYDNSGQTITTGSASILDLAVGEKRLVAGCQNGNLLVLDWDGQSLQPARSFAGPGGEVLCVLLHANSETAFVATRAGFVAVMDLTNGQLVAEVTRHPQAVHSVQAAQNGLIATGSEDGTIRLIRSRNGRDFEPLLTLAPRSGPIRRVRLSDDGRYLAVSFDQSPLVRVWDLSSLRRDMGVWNLDW